ncbi:MAG TPA: SDR family NAD(P)-dependent oxidoreductase [Steroidobacteraceae bacterium]|jgi:NAD(P)-dependent dehydrogenase (short-subunit alcohol dehydrogenase family)
MTGADFANQVVLVAGGTGALGRAVCLAFAGQGAKIVATYRSHQEFQSLETAATSAGVNVEGAQVDVTDESAVQGLVSQLIKNHGTVDVVVNAVGGYAGGSKAWEHGAEVLDRMLSLNLRALFCVARAVIPAMLERKRGAIVNVAAKAGLDHPSGSAVYAASKAAALSLAGTLATELKGTGVRINSVLPNVIDTPANRREMGKPTGAPGWVSPEEIARVIVFLSSPEAQSIQGAAIAVYGS